MVFSSALNKQTRVISPHHSQTIMPPKFYSTKRIDTVALIELLASNFSSFFEVEVHAPKRPNGVCVSAHFENDFKANDG